MELDWIWKVVIIFFVGTFILRVGGRKSISQMTISQTIVMIGLGSLLVQPLAGKGLIITLLSAFFITLVMVITEYVEIKFDFLENLFIGKSVIVIEDGNINLDNLKKIRLSIDMLETRLRQVGISSIDDVKYATIEVSGQLGYELKENKKPITKGELQKLSNDIYELKKYISNNLILQSDNKNNIFTEIETRKFEGNENEP